MFRALKFWTVIQFNILKTTYAFENVFEGE